MAAFLVLTLAIILPQMLVLAFHKGRGSYIIPKFWHRTVCLIFGIQYKMIGTPYTSSQTLYMSNHLSYLDIPLIGSLLVASFVAKEDVAGWAGFGFLAKLQQTAFISRARGQAKAGKHLLENMMKDGKSLILFPEGTSTDGRSVYPFKSTLFSIAQNSNNPDLMIQPMTLRMEKVDGHDIKTQDDRDLYSWHINMDTELPVHLWRFACTSGALISLIFHSPIKASDYEDRKTLAKL